MPTAVDCAKRGKGEVVEATGGCRCPHGMMLMGTPEHCMLASTASMPTAVDCAKRGKGEVVEATGGCRCPHGMMLKGTPEHCMA